MKLENKCQFYTFHLTENKFNFITKTKLPITLEGYTSYCVR